MDVGGLGELTPNINKNNKLSLGQQRDIAVRDADSRLPHLAGADAHIGGKTLGRPSLPFDRARMDGAPTGRDLERGIKVALRARGGLAEEFAARGWTSCASSAEALSAVQAAAKTTERQDSRSTIMSAQRCWTAWKVPIAAPYCLRSRT